MIYYKARKIIAAQVIGWRAKAFASQRGRCLWCNRPMANRRIEMRQFPERRVTADHLIPSGSGGPDEAWNIIAACYKCNHRRGNRPVSEWVAALHLEYTTADFAILLSKLTIFGIEALIGHPAHAAPTVENPIVRAPEVETLAP